MDFGRDKRAVSVSLFIYLFICTEQSALLVCSGKKQQQKTVLT